MALFTGEGGGTPLFDSSTSLAMRRRLTEAAGSVMIVLSCAIGLLIWSYHPDDPSVWNATSRTPQNLLGLPGAFVADPMMKFIGLGGWALVALIGVWGWRCLLHKGCERIWARLALMPLALISLSVFASTHAVGPDWPLSVGLGGLLGDHGARALLDLIPLPDDDSLFLLSLGLFPITVALLGAALGMSGSEVSRLWLWLSRSFRQVMGRILVMLGIGAVAGAKAAGRE